MKPLEHNTPVYPADSTLRERIWARLGWMAHEGQHMRRVFRQQSKKARRMYAEAVRG